MWVRDKWRHAGLSCRQQAFDKCSSLTSVSMAAATEIGDVRAISRRPHMDAQTGAFHLHLCVREMAPCSASVSAVGVQWLQLPPIAFHGRSNQDWPGVCLQLQLPHIRFHGRGDRDWRGARYFPSVSRTDAQTGGLHTSRQTCVCVCVRWRDDCRVRRGRFPTSGPSNPFPLT